MALIICLIKQGAVISEVLFQLVDWKSSELTLRAREMVNGLVKD